MDILERVTDEARRVLDLAQDEARQQNINHIGTEHLLLGLFCEDDGMARRVLLRLGADLNELGRRVIRLLQENRADGSSAE